MVGGSRWCVSMTEQDKIFDGKKNDSVEDAKPVGGSEPEGRYKLSPLTLTVFKRETENGVFRNYQLQRAFTRDDGDSFEYTTSLRKQDLRKAARLFEMAADDVQGLEKKAAGGDK